MHSAAENLTVLASVILVHNAELRHSRWGQRHDGAQKQRISRERRKGKGRRLLPQVIRYACVRLSPVYLLLSENKLMPATPAKTLEAHKNPRARFC